MKQISLRLSLVLLVAPAPFMLGWNAQFTPAEQNVTWPLPEDSISRALTLFRHPSVAGPR